jgi:uncharacterized protein YegL
MGKNVDYQTLKQLTEHCIAFDELNEHDFKSFSNGSVLLY